MTTAAELIRRAREAYSRDEPRDSTSSSDRQYTRGATGTPTGGQFATTAGTAQAKPKPTAKLVAKKPAPKATVKKPPTTLDQAMTRQYANFGSISAHTPAGDQRIKDMQAMMAGLGIQVAQDGKFGPEMTAAVKALQAKVGSKPTGRVTSSLFRKLQSAAILSPCTRASEGVLFGAADLLRRAREGYNPDQLRAKQGTGIGGRWVSMGAVVAALKGKGHHDAAASLSHLDGPSVSAHHGPTRRPASHTPQIAHGGDRVKADRLHAEIGRLDEQHGARLHAGSAMLDPEARRQNRLQAHQLRSELAPAQARLDTEAAIKADNLETRGLIGDVPEGDHLAAARAHVASMQGGKPDPQAAMSTSDILRGGTWATPETGTGLPATATPKARALSALDAIAADISSDPRAHVPAMGAESPLDTVARLRSRVESGDLPVDKLDALLGRMTLRFSRADGDPIGEAFSRHSLELKNTGTPAPKKTAAAKMARATPTERRRQQRVDMLDKAIQDAASDPELSRAQVGGARSVVDGLRRIRDQIAEGRQGDEATVQDLNNAVQHRSLSGDSQRIMSDLIAEHARLAAEHRVPEPRPGAAAKVARAKAGAESPETIAAKIQGAASEEEAKALMQGLTAAQLKSIAPHVGVEQTSGRKADLVDRIAYFGAGARTDSAILRSRGGVPLQSTSRPGPSSISPGASTVSRYDSRKVDGQWGVYAIGPDGSARLVEPAGSEGAANNRAGNMDAALDRSGVVTAPAPAAPAAKVAAAKATAPSVLYNPDSPGWGALAGAWDTPPATRGAPMAPSAPTPITPAEAERRRKILAAPLAQPRAMRPEDGAGVFSADPETARRAAAALDAKTPAKRATAAQKMTRAKAAAPFSAPDVAATMRRLGNEDAIAQELQRVKATDLRALTDELNIKFPPQARTAAARKLYIAQTLAADNRRYHGGI